LCVSYFRIIFRIDGSTPVLEESAQNKEPVRQQKLFLFTNTSEKILEPIQPVN